VTAPEPQTAESADLFDYALLRAWAGFGLRSLSRHALRAALAFLLVVAAAVAALALMPRTWHTETTLVAERNQVMPALGNPNRAVPRDADAPTRQASETVLRRDNLLALIRQTNLEKKWDESRAPLMRTRDHLVRLVTGPPTQDEKLDALVGLLEKRLKVTTGDGTVTIAVDWPDRRMAYELVEAAQQNFIETRHTVEASAISEAISILEWHVGSLRGDIQTLVDRLRRAQKPAPRAAPRPVVHAVPARVAAPKRAPDAPPAFVDAAQPAPESTEDQEIAQLRGTLTARQRAVADLEEYRRKRLAELQVHLAEQSAVYAPAHPAVVALQESISALSKDSPQLESLRRERDDLTRELADRVEERSKAVAAARAAAVAKAAADALAAAEAETAARAAETAQAKETPPPRPVRVAKAPPPPDRDEGTAQPSVATETSATAHGDIEPDDEATLDYTRTLLRIATDKYQELVGRLESARIELDTARAAFKYRYNVVRPPQVPKRPSKPNPVVLVAGGLAGGVLLALFMAIGADLRAGRIEEPWQVERQLGIPLLAVAERT